MLLSEAIEALCIATRADGRSRRTVAAYREKLGHLLTSLGDVEVGRVTLADLRGYVASMRDRTTVYTDHPTRKQEKRSLSPFTVNTRVKAMKRLFRWLTLEGVLEADPSSRIEAKQPKHQEPKGIAEDDVRALLTVCGDDLAGVRDQAAILFLYDTGCRAAGLCGLRGDDLDLENGLAAVTEKGDRMRFVMFTPTTARALARWLEVRLKGEHVFVGMKGTGVFTPNTLWQMLKRRARQAGVTAPVGPHSFRHAFARQYLLDGGDLGTLADILGHSDVRTTAAYYARFTIGELQRKHAKHSPVAQMFGGNGDGK